MQLPGLIVAPLTPFTANLGVDLPALRRQIDYAIVRPPWSSRPGSRHRNWHLRPPCVLRAEIAQSKARAL